MIRIIIRRLLWLPILLLIVSMITWALGLYGPGDPCILRLGQRRDPDAVARCRQELGLDRPFVVQYAEYVWNALHGDFGISYKYNRPVMDLIGARLLVSAQINVVALFLGVVIGVPLGVLAALRRNTWIDYLIVTGTVAGISLPTFVLAPLLLWVFAFRYRLLPPGGWEGLFSKTVILPALILATGTVAVFMRQTRANMLQVIGQDYVRTAWAKGLTPRMVIYGHALRNALIPLFTIFGLAIAGLLSGTFIVETFFGVPGIGLLGVESFFGRDYPVIMALTLIAAVSYVMATLLIDVGYAFIDPRIRYD